MPKKFNLKTEVLLALTKILSLGVVALACGVAIYYCTHIYYDREVALHDALVCSSDILSSHGYSSWLTNGTLLGAVRLQRFIMWDGEIDVAVLNDVAGNMSALDGVVSAIENQCFPYSRSLHTTGPGEPRRWRLCTSRVCAEIHEFCPEPNESGWLWSVDGRVPTTQVLPLASCDVEGVTAMCPANSTYFLDAAFGPQWRSGSLTSLFF